jgi:hypothetical protein
MASSLIQFESGINKVLERSALYRGQAIDSSLHFRFFSPAAADMDFEKSTSTRQQAKLKCQFVFIQKQANWVEITLPGVATRRRRKAFEKF